MLLFPSFGVVNRIGTERSALKKGRLYLRAEIEKTLLRDDYSCRCCGFKSRKYQKIVPDPNPDAKGSFITVCGFCEACLYLDKSGVVNGVLIWLPEISQVDLNHIMRAIYVLRDSKHPLAEMANKAFDALMSRRAEAKKRLGSDDPLVLAAVLSESLTDAEYNKREAKLEGIRFLPLDKWLVRGRNGTEDHFPRVLEYWRSPEGPFGKLPPDAWKALFDSVLTAANKAH